MTPESEAPAQLTSSGIPGSYPVVLDFEAVDSDSERHKSEDVAAKESVPE
jgi:hypothetical protein